MSREEYPRSRIDVPHLVVEHVGSVYVADTNNHRIQVFTKEGRFLRTLGVTAVEGSDNYRFNKPHDVCVVDGYVYVTDSFNHRIQVHSQDGRFVRTLGVTGLQGKGNHQFSFPIGVCVEPGVDGCIYISDWGNKRVQVLTKKGVYVRTIGVGGDVPLCCPWGISADWGPGYLYIADPHNDRVQVFTKNGAYVRTMGITGEEGLDNQHLNRPDYVMVGPRPSHEGGLVYVSDSENHRVQVYLKS